VPLPDAASPTLPVVWNPNPDLDAAATLGEALRGVGYTPEAIEELLGEDGIAADLEDSVVFERRLPRSPLATTIRLLLLQRPVAEADARAAFGPVGADALARLGFMAFEGGLVVPRARVVPTEHLLLCFDGFSRGEDDPPGWVASFTPTAFWLAALTPRRRVERALDIGTGNGAHALLAAGHSDHVIATDVNSRALAFTQISAAVNGIDNVETRHGSLFEPVAGETFDLITCNAPYVVSPESRWQYRDGGLPGDQLSERVVRQAPLHLTDGGHASVIVSWLAESEDDPDERIFEWLEENGCDAWVLSLSGSDPLDHAAGWNERFSGDAETMGAALDEWAAYFDALDAAWVSEGGVLMRKRDGDHNVVRSDDVEEDDLERASAQIERVFTALEFSAERGADALRDARLRLAPTVEFVQELDRRGNVVESRILLDEGTHTEIELDEEAVRVLTRLDGQRTLEETIGRREPTDELLELIENLFELGFFELVRVRV